jgi:hypothetical protein
MYCRIGAEVVEAKIEKGSKKAAAPDDLCAAASDLQRFVYHPRS